MVRRGRGVETKMVLPRSSPSCLTSLPAPSSIQGGMSSGSLLLRFPVPLSAMAQSLRKKRAEHGAGWVTSRTDGVLFFLGLFAVLIKESDVCCFCGWCEVGVALWHPDFFHKNCAWQWADIVLCYVQAACPPPVVQDQHVLHTPGRHSLWSLGRNCWSRQLFSRFPFSQRSLLFLVPCVSQAEQNILIWGDSSVVWWKQELVWCWHVALGIVSSPCC